MSKKLKINPNILISDGIYEMPLLYLFNRCIYSIDEKPIGIHKDGKIIYRKCYTKINNGSRDVLVEVTHDIDTMGELKVMARHKEDGANTISYSSGNTPRGASYFPPNAPWMPNKIYVVEITDYKYIDITIEYTKTV